LVDTFAGTAYPFFDASTAKTSESSPMSCPIHSLDRREAEIAAAQRVGAAAVRRSVIVGVIIIGQEARP